tara:strand:+ start:483 stop:812 length:330 start_codon:yes stop_codon:yes gene_type:complete
VCTLVPAPEGAIAVLRQDPILAAASSTSPGTTDVGAGAAALLGLDLPGAEPGTPAGFGDWRTPAPVPVDLPEAETPEGLELAKVLTGLNCEGFTTLPGALRGSLGLPPC